MVSSRGRLRAVKVLHTLIWAVFSACIVAIPILGWTGQHFWAALFSLMVFGEGVVLLFNGWRCPLTAIAARYTDDRRDNFDIYLPGWLARHNKSICSVLYIGGMLVAGMSWAGWLR
jgi:polyferredoxin